jgi:hypothetical protein
MTPVTEIPALQNCTKRHPACFIEHYYGGYGFCPGCKPRGEMFAEYIETGDW